MITSISFNPTSNDTWVSVLPDNSIISLSHKLDKWTCTITPYGVTTTNPPISTTVDSIYQVQSFLHHTVGGRVTFRYPEPKESPSPSPPPTQPSKVDTAGGLCYDSYVEASEPTPLPPSSGASISKGETMSTDFRDVLQSIENAKSEAEEVLETVKNKAGELNDLESTIEEKIDELGEVEDTLTRMEELVGELESSADDFKYIMES